MMKNTAKYGGRMCKAMQWIYTISCPDNVLLEKAMGCNEVTACHEGLRKKTSSAFICVGLVNTEGFA